MISLMKWTQIIKKKFFSLFVQNIAPCDVISGCHLSNLSVHRGLSFLSIVVLHESLDGLVANVVVRTVQQQVVGMLNNSFDGRTSNRRIVGSVKNDVATVVAAVADGSRVDILRFGLPSVPPKLLSIRQIKTRSGLQKEWKRLVTGKFNTLT